MLENLFFLLVCVLFSVVYAKIEFGLDKWWVELGKDPSGFWSKQIFGLKWNPYHYWMLVLDLIVNLPALVLGSLSLYLACVLIFPLLEDAAYFWWGRKWIKPTDWTAREGSVTWFGITIPYWYFVLGTIIGLLLVPSML